MKYYQMMKSPKDLIKNYIEKCHVNDPMFIGKHDNRSKVGFEPIISDIILNEGERIPDFFSAGGMLSPRLIVSSRLKSFLEKCCESACIEFFPITLIQSKEKVEGYWITNFISFSDDSLDFDRTTFYVDTDTPIKNKYGVYVDRTRNTELRKFNNLSEFLKVKKEGWGNGVSVYPKRPFVKESEKRPILLFDKVPILGIIVSEDLKKEIEENGFQGIEFKPLEIPDEEWYGPNGLRKQFYK
ncbi:hypothetical protein [Algoriphagus sp.]|uniref:hypothetical protein n=1 Tax=Algoriphagus sp. TaxID=1872435 RepID=UPI00262A86CD|nr:hypothetical protein [Algoriphagus sp.]